MRNKALLRQRFCLPDHSFPDGSILETSELRAGSPELTEFSGLEGRKGWEEIKEMSRGTVQ